MTVSMWRQSYGLFVCGVLLMTGVGCSSSNVPMQRTYKTTGRVLLDGQPVGGLDVRFIPKDKTEFKLEETPLGRTDEQGNFTLTTYNTGDGAPAGEYLVAVSYPDQVPVPEEADETAAAIAFSKAKKEKGAKPRFPQIYQVPQKSGLSATVPKGGGELPPFELSSSQK